MTWLHPDQALPIAPPLALPLTRGLFLVIVRQFDVERSARYRPADGKTWCNLYLADLAVAFGKPLFRVVDERGNPVLISVTGARYLRANDMIDWLTSHGTARYGWREIDLADAEVRAGNGAFVVVAWQNPKADESGHVALMLPDGTITQAGRTNHATCSIAHGFGDRPLRFFTHP